MWPIFEKKCQNVFFCRRNKEETYVQTFQQFLQKQNNKQKLMVKMDWLHAQKKKKKLNKKKNLVPDKILINDSVTTEKTVWTINWTKLTFNVEKSINTKMVIIKIVLEVFLKTLSWFIIQCSIKLQDKSPLNPPKTYRNGHLFFSCSTRHASSNNFQNKNVICMLVVSPSCQY